MLVGRSHPVSVKQLLSRMLVILVRERRSAHSFPLLGSSAEGKTERAAGKVSISSRVC